MPGFFDTFNLEQVVPLAMKKFDIELAKKKLGMEEEKLNLKKEEIKRSITQRETFTKMLMPMLTGQGATETPGLENIMPTSTELPKPSQAGPKGIDPNKAILAFLGSGGEPEKALSQIVELAKKEMPSPRVSKLLTPEEELQQIRIAGGKQGAKLLTPEQEEQQIRIAREKAEQKPTKATLEQNKEESRQELLSVLSEKNLDFPLPTKEAETAIPKDILRRAQSVGVLTKDFQGNKYQWAGQQKESPWMAVATGEKPVGTPEQISSDVNAIMNYQTTLQDVQSGGGMGGIGAAYGRQLRTEILKRDPNFNFALQKLYFSGDQSEVRANKTLRGKIAQFEETAIQNAKQVYNLSSKIDVTKIPLLNSLVLKGETHLAGDKVASNYLLAWRTFINEYARVATTSTGAGVTSDQARKEMETAIKSAYTPEQIQALMRQATLEMKHRIYGFDKSLNRVLQRWGEKEENAPRLVTSEDIYKIFSGYTPEVTPEQQTEKPKSWEELKKKKGW